MSNGYGSHIPVMECVYPHIPHIHALEFGCGSQSTPWLLSHFETVTSIELNETYAREIPDTDKWNCIITNDEIRLLQHMDIPTADIILVDGGNVQAREHVAQICLSMHLSDHVLMHDGNEYAYGYQHINVPLGYTYMQCRGHKPFTNIATTNPGIYGALPDMWIAPFVPRKTDKPYEQM